MCPGCSWCCIGEKEPIYPVFEKKHKAESSTGDNDGKASGMIDIGAWEEKNVPGAKEYYKEIDTKIKSRVWISNRSAAHNE